MKTLIFSRSGMKSGIDQAAMSGLHPPITYVPIENLQRFTENAQALGGPLGPLAQITAYQCVRFLANTYAQIPTILYRRRGDDGKERATDHPLFRTFAVAANRSMSAFEWKQLAKAQVETVGNHFSDIVELGDGTIEFWPIRADRVEVYWDRSGAKAYDYLSPTGGRKTLDPSRVFHLKAMTIDGLVGIPPIEAMRRAIGLARRAERYGESVFDNGARPSIVVEHPMTLSDGAVDRLGAQMDTLRGAGNAGKTVILEEGSKVHEIGFPPEDAQFMETRLFQKREIAAGYGVTLGMLNDPDAEEDEDQESRKFMKRTMVPAFEAFEQAAQIQVIRDDEYFVEFLADAYLRGDPKARADAYAVQWEHGALNGDEWRRRENMDPLPDKLGETYYRPANWVPLGQQDEEPPAVGGDASAATQFGADAALVDQTTRAKSASWPDVDGPLMAQFDCPDCGRLIARKAAPGTVGHCRSCRSEKTFERTGQAA